MDSKSRASRIRDLVRFLSSVKGDLANISAPPYWLAPSSVTEVGHCWAQHPRLFAAPAAEPDPARRALLVLRHTLAALRSQLYIAGSPSVSIKKPLNAFLGEVFLADYISPYVDQDDEKYHTHLVAEQVSHHPPITAMHLSDAAHGVRADGYARVEMSFSGAVDVKQVGHAVLHIDNFDEDYLIPLPDVQVRGYLSGRLYPEAGGNYSIESTSGYASEIRFHGAGFCWGGTKNGFEAVVFKRDDPDKTPIYTLSGVWSEAWTVKDGKTGRVLEKFDHDDPAHAPAEEIVPPLREQSPWESRRAWHGVREALMSGHLREAVAEKTRLEQAQRDMRARESKAGETWTPLLFRSFEGEDHRVYHELAKGTPWEDALCDDRTKGVWRIDESKLGSERPSHGELTPFG